ncbi:hypothetical protein Sjap_018878 [Stephania japonica]|uniref:Uncharacterized protein n=1 Tax=Stephania japonica TaxID=461633 RepID=A0AAP0I8V6_9MAGN
MQTAAGAFGGGLHRRTECNTAYGGKCGEQQPFRNFKLWTWKEKEIATVTHRGFMFHTLNALGKDLHPLMEAEVVKHVIGSGNSETNYNGKIPCRLDLPSDSAPERHSEKVTSKSSA